MGWAMLTRLGRARLADAEAGQRPPAGRVGSPVAGRRPQTQTGPAAPRGPKPSLAGPRGTSALREGGEPLL
eukprot:3992301-Alexandrium_andersonii.AAC.1